MALSPRGRQPVFGGLDDDDDEDDDYSDRPRHQYREDYRSGLQEYASDDHSLASSLTCSVEGSSGDEDSEYDDSDGQDAGYQGYHVSINALGYHEDEEEQMHKQVSVNALGYHLEEPSLHTDSRPRSRNRGHSRGHDGRRHSGGHNSGGHNAGPKRNSMDLIKNIAFPWGRKEQEGPPREVALITRVPRRMSTGGTVPVRHRAAPTTHSAAKKPTTSARKLPNRRGSLLGLMPVKNLPSLPIGNIFGRDAETKAQQEADAFKKVADELFG